MRAHGAAADRRTTTFAKTFDVRRWRALSAVVLMCGVGAGPSALAQAIEGPGPEVPIGTFNIGTPQNGFSVMEPPSGVPESPPSSGEGDGGKWWFFEGWQKASPNDSAERLYADAMAALQEGRTDEAQRTLERLIAESPRSAQAAEARRHLGRIYSGGMPNAAGAASAPSANATSPAARETAFPLPSVAVPVSQKPAYEIDLPIARNVLVHSRVSADVDGEFLTMAGDRVFFSAGSTSLGTRAQSVIQAQARFLKQNPWLSAAVEGHADDGAIPDGETQRLSELRAAVVRDRLIAEGISSERLTAYGRGREERVSDCPESQCLAQNRRAITILLKGLPSTKSRAKGSASAAPSAQTQ